MGCYHDRVRSTLTVLSLLLAIAACAAAIRSSPWRAIATPCSRPRRCASRAPACRPGPRRSHRNCLRSDAHGLLQVAVDGKGAHYLVVGHCARSFNRNEVTCEPPPEYRAYAYTDRPIYRPGHTVSYEAVIRRLPAGSNEYVNVPHQKLTVEIQDSLGSVLQRDEKETNANGSLDGTYAIAAVPPLNGAKFKYSVYEKPYRAPAIPAPGEDDSYLAEVDVTYPDVRGNTRAATLEAVP